MKFMQTMFNEACRFRFLRLERAGVVPLSIAACAGCHQDMYDQPRAEALEASSFFPDNKAARSLPPGVIARGHLRLDDAMYRGMVDGQPVTELPIELTAEVMARGQQKFNIFCANC